jgi:hypothetical protein
MGVDNIVTYLIFGSDNQCNASLDNNQIIAEP